MKTRLLSIFNWTMLISLLMIIYGCGGNRKGNIFLIPDGYIGWINIYYGKIGFPELQVKSGHYLISTDSSGNYFTSTKMEEGWAKDDYYYYSPSIQKEIKSTGWGGGGLVWGECTRSDPKVVGYNIIESFFIGTEQQFKDIGYKTNPTILNGFRN